MKKRVSRRRKLLVNVKLLLLKMQRWGRVTYLKLTFHKERLTGEQTGVADSVFKSSSAL